MAKSLNDIEFVKILTSTQVRLRAYALSLVRTTADADDIIQSACVTLWKKRENYDSERDFFPWACGYVFIEVLRLRRKKATDRLMFDESLLNTLAEDYVNNVTEYDLRQDQLQRCVERLTAEDKCLLEARYYKDTPPKKISADRGVPVTTIYSALSRIREALHRCIQSNLAHHNHS